MIRHRLNYLYARISMFIYFTVSTKHFYWPAKMDASKKEFNKGILRFTKLDTLKIIQNLALDCKKVHKKYFGREVLD